MNKTVYLAGAIDRVSPEFAMSWRQEATKRLGVAGYQVLDPTQDKKLEHPDVNTTLYTPEQIVETDKQLINRSTIVLAEVSRTDIPYIGTSMEIYFAWERAIPVIVWGGSRSYWIRYHATKIFDTLGEALDCLEKVQS